MRTAIVTVPLTLLLSSAMAINLSGQSSKRNIPPQNENTASQRSAKPCRAPGATDDEVMEETQVEWRVAAKTKAATYYYNTKKMLCDRGVLRVWVKTVIDDSKKAVLRFELNCQSDQVRIISATDYDLGSGTVVGERTHKNPKWDDVIPDSVEHGILMTVCHKKS